MAKKKKSKKYSVQDDIGPLVKRLRKDLGVSQTEWGKILDLHQAGVSRVESGSQFLTPEQLILLYRLAMERANLRLRAEWRYLLTGDEDIFDQDLQAAVDAEKEAESLQRAAVREDKETRKSLGAG
jgi:transcriptional regulator with XRE-family HTH domain